MADCKAKTTMRELKSARGFVAEKSRIAKEVFRRTRGDVHLSIKS